MSEIQEIKMAEGGPFPAEKQAVYLTQVNRCLRCKHKWSGCVKLTNPLIYTCIKCGIHRHGEGKKSWLSIDGCIEGGSVQGIPYPDGMVILKQTISSKPKMLNIKWSVQEPQKVVAVYNEDAIEELVKDWEKKHGITGPSLDPDDGV